MQSYHQLKENAEAYMYVNQSGTLIFKDVSFYHVRCCMQV